MAHLGERKEEKIKNLNSLKFNFCRNYLRVYCVPGTVLDSFYDLVFSVQLLSHLFSPAAQSSFQFSCSVVSESLQPHGLQHVRLSYSSTPELAQTYVHRVGDAIQPSHPLSSPSPPAFNPSQHQGLFQWVSSLHQVAKVLEPQLQHLLALI